MSDVDEAVDDDEIDGNEIDGNEIDGNEVDDEAVDDDQVDGNRAVGAISQAVLEYLAKSIVDDADSVVVEVEPGRGGVSLRLHVAPADMGRVIGRRGRVAQAIRTVVRAAGAKEGIEAEVDIVD